MARAIFVLFALIGAVHATSKGAPESSCADMIPRHYGTIMSTTLRYEIASACYVFQPMESMAISVWDRYADGPIKGVFLQVRDSGDNIVGTWNVGDSDLKTITCVPGNPLSAVTHANNKVIPASDTSVLWTAPSSCSDSEEFKIRATVCKDFSRWIIVDFLMICKPDYSNAALMERVRPPFKSLYCSQGSWAILPKGASDGFETGLARGGWRHFYGAAGLRFERVMSPAAGSSSAMPQASEGSYYLYYKAKGTKKDDMAGLLSPFGIKGCFCLSFDCYMDTDGVTRFTLSSIGAVQAQLLDVTEVTDFWRSVQISITTVKPVLLAFQVFNSGVQTGGVGLDNIMFKAGPCGGDALVADLTTASDP